MQQKDILARSDALIRRKYREYFMSTLVMSGCASISSIVDRIMIGNLLGADALSASSLVAPYIYIVNAVFALFIFGGNTLAVTYKARCDSKSADKCFTISILLGAAVMAVLGAVCLLFRGPVTQVLTSGKVQLYNLVYDYFTPHFLLGVLVILVNGVSAYLRADGLKKLAVTLPLVVNGVNLLCDYIFMGPLHLGIGSAAWATNIGFIAALLMVVPYYRSPARSVHFARLQVSDLGLVREAIHTGMATALTHFCTFLKNMIMNMVILSALGTLGMRSVSVCLSAQSVAMIFFNGSSHTMLPIAGALYGEQDYRGLRQLLRIGNRTMALICLGILAVFLAFPAQIGAVFGVTDPETLRILCPAFRMYAFCIPLNGILYILRSHYQAAGHKNAATMLTMLEGIAFFIPAIWLLGRFVPGLLWLSFAISPLLALAVTILFMQGKAKREGYADYLMIPEDREAVSFEFSIRNRIDEAEAVSELVIGQCRENGVSGRDATLMGTAAEELCTNIARHAYKDRAESVDVFLKIYQDHCLLKIRDNGSPFNPVQYMDEAGKELTGLTFLRSLPVTVSYNRVLGFNVTIVRLARKDAKQNQKNKKKENQRQWKKRTTN